MDKSIIPHVGDMERLNHCLDTLESTDLGQSLVWLWTWSTIKDYMVDEDFKFNLSEVDIWTKLVESVDKGGDFNLLYGAEQHQEDVLDWLLAENIMTDMMSLQEE